MGQPTAVIITDTNGKAYLVTGTTSGQQVAAPTPVVLTDVNGNALQFGAAAIPNGSTATTQAFGDASTQIATDQFVANAIAGVNSAESVLIATTANLTGTYASVGAGIGDTFTITATGATTIDGVAITTIGQRVLLKNQTDGTQNGVYTVTVVGTTGVSTVFTRAADYNTPASINSTGVVPVQSGTANGSTTWLQTATVVTIGPAGTALTLAQFSYAPSNVATLNAALNAFTGTISVGGNVEFSTLSVAAAGSNQGGATALTADNNFVTSGTGGVKLPVAVAGMEISITNDTASSITVYPASGASIEQLAANTGFVLPAYVTVALQAKSTTQWWTISPVVVAGTNIVFTETGSGTLVIALSATPALGTPASGVLTNCTGLPAASVVAGTLPNGFLTTTQAVFSNDTKLATDAYVDALMKSAGLNWFREDFDGGTSNAAITTAVAFGCGSTNWSAAQISGGTQGITGTDGTFANPGILTFTVSSTSGQGVSLYKGNGGKGVLGNLAAQGGWEINIIAKLVQTATCAIRLGVCKSGTQVTDPPSDGIYVEYDTANTGNTNTDFTWVTRSAATSNYSTTNAIAADTNFHHFRIRSTVAGTILFSVDGGSEASVSTDVSTALMLPFIQFANRTSSGTPSCVIDFYSYVAATGRT